MYYTLQEIAMALSSTLTLTVLPQVKNPFNYKTAQHPAQCSFCLQEFQAPAHCFQFSHTFFLSFQTTSLGCENCSAVIPHSSTISETAQLSSTANLVVLIIKAEKAIPRCLTALKTITGFCT